MQGRRKGERSEVPEQNEEPNKALDAHMAKSITYTQIYSNTILSQAGTHGHSQLKQPKISVRGCLQEEST